MRRMLLTLPLLVAGPVCAQDVPDDYFSPVADIPVVLTATRLKQPRAEVPASVTVIEAEQIRLWGLRTIPDLLRFVPGMVVGHSQSENSDTVVYHASVQNFMRRMQVQVDGRAVYKSAIAQVTWDDIPIALEDIQRIEITRGPSSATYGANAFMAVINIITKNPEQSLGTRLRYQGGNQSVNDSFASYSALTSQGGYRISAGHYSDDGFDGEKAAKGEDLWNDDSRQSFVSLRYDQALGNGVQWQLRGGLNRSHADIGTRSVETSQWRDTDSAFVQSNLEFDFSDRHQSRLQVYWQREKREQRQFECVSTILLDPALFQLYRLNPEGTKRLVEERITDPQAVNDILTTPEQLGLYTQVLSRDGVNPDEKVCGTGQTDVVDQRVDIEWQDTVIWTDRLRTVSGLNLRQDEADSDALFKGSRRNRLVRAFGNLEWRVQPWLLLNAGATYEREDINKSAFSPRLALNWLLSPQQSIRTVFSQAVRSPDMLEQSPDWTLTAYDLKPNYLGLTEGTYFASRVAEDRQLDQERITSYEVGYYHLLPGWNLELDIKVYRDRLRDLISSSIVLENPVLLSGDRMDIKGTEMQLQWQPRHSDRLWMTLAYTDAEADRPAEVRISPRKTLTSSWQHRAESWSSTLSYLRIDSYDNGAKLYHRTEVYLRKNFQLGRYKPWVGAFWQHQFERNALGHYTQRYAAPNIYYLQAGMDF